MRDWARARSRLVVGGALGLVVAVSAVIGAVASGSGGNSSPQTPAEAFAPAASSIVTTATATATSAAPATRLSIVYRPRGEGGIAHAWTLTCDPTGGTLPSRVVACRELAAHGGDLIHPGVQCMVIVLHAPTATVTGTWAGHPVHYVSSTCSQAWSTLRAVLTGSSSAA